VQSVTGAEFIEELDHIRVEVEVIVPEDGAIGGEDAEGVLCIFSHDRPAMAAVDEDEIGLIEVIFGVEGHGIGAELADAFFHWGAEEGFSDALSAGGDVALIDLVELGDSAGGGIIGEVDGVESAMLRGVESHGVGADAEIGAELEDIGRADGLDERGEGVVVGLIADVAEFCGGAWEGDVGDGLMGDPVEDFGEGEERDSGAGAESESTGGGAGFEGGVLSLGVEPVEEEDLSEVADPGDAFGRVAHVEVGRISGVPEPIGFVRSIGGCG